MIRELNKINMCKQPLKCYKKFVKIVNENISTKKYRDCPSEHIKRMYGYIRYLKNEELEEKEEDNNVSINFNDKEEIEKINIKQIDM